MKNVTRHKSRTTETTNGADAVPRTKPKHYPHIPGAETLTQETNILKAEGLLFDFRRKHQDKKIFELTVMDGEGYNVSIEWHPKYGRPSTVAYFVLQALFIKSTAEGRPFPQSVAFRQNEIIRLIDRTDCGKTHDDIALAIGQLKRVFLKGRFHDKGKGEIREVEFGILAPSSVLVRDDKTSAVTHGLVYWDPLIVQSMNDEHWATFNWSKIKGSSAIEVALHKRLFYHFSNIAGGMVAELERQGIATPDRVRSELGKITFNKNLSDMFRTWLGGIKIPDRVSHLKREHGPKFDTLKEHGLVSHWSLRPSADRKGHTFVARPSKGFIDDYLALYHGKTQPSLKFATAKDSVEIADPVELVMLFHTSFSGVKKLDTDSFAQSEYTFATELLRKYGRDASRRFVAFAVATAKHDDYTPRLMTGVRSYVNAWLAIEEGQRMTAKRDDARKSESAKARLEEEYRRYVEQTCEAWIASQPEPARRKLVADAAARLKPSAAEGSFGQMFLKIELRKLTQTKISIPTFEQWKKQRT